MADSNNGRRHELMQANLVPAVDYAQSDLHHDTIRQCVSHTDLRWDVLREDIVEAVATVFLAR